MQVQYCLIAQYFNDVYQFWAGLKGCIPMIQPDVDISAFRSLISVGCFSVGFIRYNVYFFVISA